MYAWYGKRRFTSLLRAKSLSRRFHVYRSLHRLPVTCNHQLWSLWKILSFHQINPSAQGTFSSGLLTVKNPRYTPITYSQKYLHKTILLSENSISRTLINKGIEAPLFLKFQGGHKFPPQIIQNKLNHINTFFFQSHVFSPSALIFRNQPFASSNKYVWCNRGFAYHSFHPIIHFSFEK